MSERKKQVVERLNGFGKVTRGEIFLSDVRYSLQIVQEIIVSRSFSGTEEIPGFKEISGQIAVISGEKELMDGNIMTLLLEDGRKWKFIPLSGNLITGNYQVVNAGGEGIV